MGIQSLMKELGDQIMNMTLYVDAKATIGMVSRKGVGSVKHIQASELWVQDAVRRGVIGIRKVDTKLNPADLMTKHLDKATRERHLPTLQMHCIAGDESQKDLADKVTDDNIDT